MKEENILTIIKDSKKMINKSCFLFCFNLFKHIFIKKENPTPNTERKLDIFIKKINEEIIRDEAKFITKDYSIINFCNILDFIKFQNKIFSSEIMEGILIYIFSFAFKAKQEKTFEQYIYNNISKLKRLSDFELYKMFDAYKFNSEEQQDFKRLINKDATFDDILAKRITQTNCVILHLFFEIFFEKYINIKNIYTSQNKFMNYEHKVFSDNHHISNNIYDRLKEDSSELLDDDNFEDSEDIFEPNPNILLRYTNFEGPPIRIIQSFLIQVFIYSQNSHSPLIKYVSKNKDSNSRYENIPFEYNLTEAGIEEKFAYIILSPIRIEPRISKIILSKNDLREWGLYEIGKTLMFNKHIKNIELKSSLLKSYYIEFLNAGMGLFYNDSVEVLNLSNNYLNDISEESLAKIISHFKGLKILILTMNDFKRGLSSFFIVLKKLYRKRKTKLENLILNRCLLDEASYYELGELLKCKYIKLKMLSIYGGNIPYNINFLKKLSKNKSIEIIYINKLEIGNNNL